MGVVTVAGHDKTEIGKLTVAHVNSELRERDKILPLGSVSSDVGEVGKRIVMLRVAGGITTHVSDARDIFGVLFPSLPCTQRART
jgi:hypothetical protein